MPATDPRDRIILEHAPLVAMPRYGELEDLPVNRHRYIAAEDGIYLEVRRPWCRLALAMDCEVTLPYGPIADVCGYAFDEEALNALIDQFLDHARAALPNECAAIGVWNEHTEQLEYRLLDADAASPNGVTYRVPELLPHESIAVDLHSHADGPAFFSDTDDADDLGAVKIAVVVGNVDTQCTVETRLCALGLFVDATANDWKCRVCGCTDDNACEGGCSWVEKDLCSRCVAV